LLRLSDCQPQDPISRAEFVGAITMPPRSLIRSFARRSGVTPIQHRFLDDTQLHPICGVTGLDNTPYRGGSAAYYFSEPITANDPKEVVAHFMALAEALR
jgi:unsaturated rhamnogalacturonyl hydrolase